MLASDAFLDFIYVGTPRAGSTWLRTVLAEHPEIRLAGRRTYLPADTVDPVIRGLERPGGVDAYRALFEGAEPYRSLGDVVPGCMADPFAAKHLARHFPHAKILVFLRDPVEMLYSLHAAETRAGRCRGGLAETLGSRPDWLELGLYHRQLLPFFDAFPAEQLCVVVYERFFTDEASHLPQLLRFLEVEEQFRPSVLGYQVEERRERTRSLKRRLSDLLAPPAVQAMVHLDITYKSQAVPEHAPVDEELRRRITDLLDSDLCRLERDLGLDLAHWRSPPDEPAPLPDNVIRLPDARTALQRMRRRAPADA